MSAHYAAIAEALLTRPAQPAIVVPTDKATRDRVLFEIFLCRVLWPVPLT